MEQEVVVVKDKDISMSFKTWCKKAFGENLDKVDVLAHYDRELNYSENKEAFTDNFESLFCDDYKEELRLKDSKERAKAEQEEQLSQIKKDEQKLVNEWKKSSYEDIDIKSFDIPKHFITMVCRGLSNSCVLVGGGGTGKTYMTINVMGKEKVDFAYQNTYTTPLELYKYIYDNKDKIIVFDDINGLWNNEKCLAILKASLWETNGKRLVTMNTSDKVLQSVPKMFEFTGKIIILSNRIDKNEHILALLSRSNYYELNFTHNEKLRIMKEIVKKPYKKTEIELRQKAFELIKSNTSIATEDMNFRNLIKTYDLLLYNSKKAESLLQSTLKENEEIKLCMTLIESNKGIQEQIGEFSLKTGKSRATFYRLKEQIKELMK